MKEDQKSLRQIIDFRIEKLQQLRGMGINPYPHKYKPTHKSNYIKNNYSEMESKIVKIAGRIMALRRMGKAAFAQVMDSEGKIQFFIRKDDVGLEMYDLFKLLDIGDYVGIEGYIFTTKTGEISVYTDILTLLSKSIRPLPIVKEKDGKTFDAFDDKEQRYRNRHLDLIVNPDTRETFVNRAKIIKSIRNYLDDRDFLEVETPVLQPIYGGANARPFTTHYNALDQTFYLRIADELYLKRLIVGGFDRVYEISKDFRNEGMDRNHNPEFTMLEFYWAYSDYKDNMDLVENIIRQAGETIGIKKVNWGGMEINLSNPFQRLSFFDLIKDVIGHDLMNASETEIKAVCEKCKIEISGKNNYGQMLDELMSKLVEPELIQPTFITDYPKAISPLAKEHRNRNAKIVERFELFIGGAEFANAFTELNDPVDQRERLEAQAVLKKLGDEEAQPLDENFIQAVEYGMPPTGGGVGIGIDRLTMLLTENRWIKDVILFPAMRTKNP
ncbi:MAG: lysine--tRNA ligase [Candidatus Marinimicrobia bacterium]|nr:lysine--tRNA ligase [Candidatus Neomarinimicrobiota bacterium]